MFRGRKNAGIINPNVRESLEKQRAREESQLVKEEEGQTIVEFNHAKEPLLPQVELTRKNVAAIPTFEGIYPFTNISKDDVMACKDMFVLVQDLYDAVPEIEKVPDQTMNTDTEELEVKFEVSKAVRSIRAFSEDQWLVADHNIHVIHSGTRGKLLIRPSPDQTGLTGITIHARDLVGLATRSFVLTVTEPPNAAMLIDEEEEQRKHDEQRNARLWSVRRVCAWIRGKGYGNKIPLFEKKIINGRALLMLTFDDLKSEFYITKDIDAQAFHEEIALLREESIDLETAAANALRRKNEAQSQRLHFIEQLKEQQEDVERQALDHARRRATGTLPSIMDKEALQIDVDLYAFAMLFGRISDEIKTSSKMLKGARFVALGSGNGMICFAAALLREFVQICGVEKDREQAVLAELFLERYHIRCRSRLSYAKRNQEILFVNSNPVEYTVDMASVIFCMWTRIQLSAENDALRALGEARGGQKRSSKRHRRAAVQHLLPDTRVRWTACWDQFSNCMPGSFLIVIIEDEAGVRAMFEAAKRKEKRRNEENDDSSDGSSSRSEEEEGEEGGEVEYGNDNDRVDTDEQSREAGEEQEEGKRSEEEEQESDNGSSSRATGATGEPKLSAGFEIESHPEEQLPGWYQMDIMTVRMASGPARVVIYAREHSYSHSLRVGDEQTAAEVKHRKIDQLQR